MHFAKKTDKNGLNILIVGCGKVGTTLVEQLCNEGHDITVVDTEASRVQALAELYDVIEFYEKDKSNYIRRIQLEKNMGDKGFKFVSASSLRKIMKGENINYSDNSSIAIKKIAESTGAQIAIVGKARAAYFTTIQGTAMKSYRSDVAITAINISDYSTIARATHQTGGVGGSDKDAYSIALVKSANSISDDFINQIVNKWQSEVQNGTEYTIYVSGLDFDDSIDFEYALKKNIGDIKNVYNRGVSGDSSRFVVQYVGTSRNLAVDINAKAKNMGYQIIINGFDDKTITLKASKK